MNKILRESITFSVTNLILFILAGWAVTGAWWLFEPVVPNVTVLHEEVLDIDLKPRTKFKRGEIVVLKRTLRVVKNPDTVIRVVRMLVTKDDHAIMDRVEVRPAMGKPDREVPRYIRYRIPENIPPQEYRIVIQAVVQLNFLRTGVYEIPPSLPFEVLP